MSTVDETLFSGAFREDVVDILVNPGDVVHTEPAGADYLLPFKRDDVLGIERVGDDLILKLNNGKEITFLDYYLYSGDTVLSFEDDGAIPLGAILGAGAAVAAAAALASDGGGSGGSPQPEWVPPTVDTNPITVGGDDAQKSFTITGTGNVGDEVKVTVGDKTITTTVGKDGTYSATFSGDNFPKDGTFSSSVTATDGGTNSRTITGPLVTVDTTPPDLEIDPLEVGSDGVLNAQEREDGLEVSGTSEAGASIAVTIDGVTKKTTADADGNWSVKFEAADLPQGSETLDVTAVAADKYGNTSTEKTSLVIDTANDVTIEQVTSDNIVSGAENAAGVSVSGTSNPGASVTVTAPGQQPLTTTSDNAGNWTVTFPANGFADGESTVTLKAVSSDSVGNTAQDTHSVQIDTILNELSFTGSSAGADGVVYSNELLEDGALRLNGSVEKGSTVSVEFNNDTYAANVDASGDWSVSIPEQDVPRGTYDAKFKVTGTDAVGNSNSIDVSIPVDTEAPTTPQVMSVTRELSGFEGVSIKDVEGTKDTTEVRADGSLSNVPQTVSDMPNDRIDLSFKTPVSTGSDLIISSEDAAGNSSATYLVLDDQQPGEKASLSNPNFRGLNIDSVDLNFAEEAELTLTENDVKDLSKHSDTLTVLGSKEDSVVMIDAQNKGSVTKDGEAFVEYSLGDVTILVDDDITNVIT